MLTKQDRCDRCGAQAIYKFSRPDSLELALLFCNHHTTEFLAELSAQGFVKAVEAAELIDA